MAKRVQFKVTWTRMSKVESPPFYSLLTEIDVLNIIPYVFSRMGLWQICPGINSAVNLKLNVNSCRRVNYSGMCESPPRKAVDFVVSAVLAWGFAPAVM